MINSVLDQYCEVSTCAGILDWRIAKTHAGKLFWILMILTGTAMTIIHSCMIFDEYLHGKSKFQTKVSLETLNSDAGAMYFPPVTICNFNRAMRSKLKKDTVSTKVMEYAFGAIPISYDMDMRTFADRGQLNISDYQLLWNEYQNRYHLNVSDMLRKYGHDCNSTIVRLRFNGFEQPIDQICNRVTEVLTSYGKCWRYFSREHPKRPGPGDGLSLLLNAATQEYPEGMVVNNFLEEGFVISIDPSFEPYFSNPIIIKPGMHAFIAASGTSQEWVNASYPMFEMNCTWNPILDYVKTDQYTASSCRLDCLARITDKYYQCVPLLDWKKGRPCNPNETMYLVRPFYEKPKDSRDPKLLEFNECERNCQDQCGTTWTTFYTMTSTDALPSHSRTAVQDITKQWIYENLGNKTVMNFTDYVKVDIYLPTLQYTKIEITEETPIFTFISNFGGNLGLYTGLCLMSLVQAVYYVFYALIRFFFRDRTKTDTIKPTSPAKITIMDGRIHVPY